jgi:tetratricopeptide (TPR) repeat protein
MDYRIEQLRFQLREDPSSRMFYQLGELLRREGELDEAVEILEQGLEAHPRYVSAWVALGRARREQGDLVGAEFACAKALQLDPENQVASRLIGEAAVDRGDWVRAIKALKLARALGPRDPELEDRIAEVESELSSRGLLRSPPPPAPTRPPPPGEAEPEAVLDGTAGDADGDGAAEPPPITARIPVVRPPRSLEVVALSNDDPFAIGASDTGVWTMPEDPFALESGEPGSVAIEEDEPSPSAEVTDDRQDEPFRDDLDSEAAATAPEVDELSQEAGDRAPDDHAPDDHALDDDHGPEPGDDGIPELARLPDIEAIAATAETISLPPRTLPLEAESPAASAVREDEEFEVEIVDDLADDVLDELEVEAPEDEDSEPAAAVIADVAVAPDALSTDALAETETETETETDADTDGDVDVWAAGGWRARADELVQASEAGASEESDAELADDAADEPGDDVPLPTLTLARLAMAQSDLELAERTLVGVLEQDPDATDATLLLEEVRERMMTERAVAAGPSANRAKIEALQGWMDAIKLASERHAL